MRPTENEKNNIPGAGGKGSGGNAAPQRPQAGPAPTASDKKSPASGEGIRFNRLNRLNRTITAPLLVLVVFLLLLAVRLLGPRIFDRSNEYLLLTVVQAVIFLLPAAIYMKLCHVKLGRLRIYPFGLNHLLLILSAVTAAASGALLLSFAVSGYESLSGNFVLYGAFATPSGDSVPKTLYLILAYAALPAFCEEFVFRALLCAEYESSGGSFSAVALTSLWFAMIHFDLRAFPVYLFSGLLLSLTLYATRSFFASFAVHLGYNLISIFGMPLLRTVYDAGGKTFYFLIVGTLLLISLFVFCGECARLYGSYADRNLSSDYRRRYSEDTSPTERRGIAASIRRGLEGNISAFLSPSALLCYLLYITVMLFIK